MSSPGPDAAPTARSGDAAGVAAPRSSSRPRGGPRFADLFRSLVPLTLLILLAVWLFSPNDGPQVPTVDPGPTLTGASRVVDFPLLAPTGLPAGWRATSATLTPTDPEGPHTLRVGYLTAGDAFAQVVQSDRPEVEVVTDVLGPGSTGAGTVEVAGQPWTRRTSSRGELALVRRVDGVSLLVTGSADAAELAVLAQSLQPLAS